ncbi:hypothetical protein AB1L42_02170 [Thalassoglobus sp. JC818]|uniref:hypothetical protein n=1 Tax=Thalassoglobus sp. JC818 TaxID=3232136 RepID=UPI003458CE9F
MGKQVKSVYDQSWWMYRQASMIQPFKLREMSMVHFQSNSDRRQFLVQSSGAVLGAAGLSFFGVLPRVSRAEASLETGRVIYKGQIEPLVELIETTDRGQLLEKVAEKIRSGTSYQEVLSALLLAGVRNVQPRPSVGFKFHTVLVVNSCHLASLHGPDEDRWLPIFWALDYFKSAQADEARQSGWQMQAVDEARVPAPEQARSLFVDAMERWDVEQADVATAALVRSSGSNELFDLYANYAARDFRSIGHKAIFLANAWRTLQVIGWQNAEPVLRSLTFAILNHEGDGDPSQHDYEADRPWRTNDPLAGEIPIEWQSGELNSTATRDLIAAMHRDSAGDVSKAAQQAIVDGVNPQSIWDAVFVSAGELLMRQPGIVGLHGLTTANAVHFIYQQTRDENLRKRLVLQACAFNPLFRGAAEGRGSLKQLSFAQWKERSDTPTNELSELSENISRDKMKASIQVRDYLNGGNNPYELIDEARRQVFLRGRNTHDYKYSSAVLEDFNSVSPEWRNDFLALSVFNLKGSGDSMSNLVERTREALQS